MILEIDSEFKLICHSILNQNKTDSEWKLIESCDMYQTKHYCGGYDAIENEFCFSYYKNDQEYWFQISLKNIKNIEKELINEIEIRLADN